MKTAAAVATEGPPIEGRQPTSGTRTLPAISRTVVAPVVAATGRVLRRVLRWVVNPAVPPIIGGHKHELTLVLKKKFRQDEHAWPPAPPILSTLPFGLLDVRIPRITATIKRNLPSFKASA